MTYTFPYKLYDPYIQADFDSITTPLTQWGSFYDTTTQTAASTATAYNVAIGNTDGALGITLSGVGRLTFSVAGLYHVSSGIQFGNSDTAAHDVRVWFRQNGTDVAYSASTYTIPAKHGTTDGHMAANDTHHMHIAAGDYIEFWWNPNNTTVYMAALPAGVTPVYPVSPTVLVDIAFGTLA